MCVLSVAGCKKKPKAQAADEGDAEPAASAAPAASSAAPDEAAAPAASAAPAADEGGAAAPTAQAEGGAADATDEGEPSTPTPTPTTAGKGGFTGSWSCFGGLTLTQQGEGVRGTYKNLRGNQTITGDITCKAVAGQCKGMLNTFTQAGGNTPKSTGHGSITFTLNQAGTQMSFIHQTPKGPQEGSCNRL